MSGWAGWRPLVFVGVVSEGLYLAFTVRLPWWRYGGWLNTWHDLLGDSLVGLGVCLAGILSLTALYAWGWRCVRRGAVARASVWGFAILFALTLWGLMPITSDLFMYLSHAHLLTDVGANPLLQASAAVANDRLLLAYATIYAGQPAVYGPAWMLLAALGTLGRYDVALGLFYLKGLAVVSFLSCAWTLEKMQQKIRPAAAVERLYLFAWNPLVLLMAVGDGHNDIIMMAAVMLSFWLLLQEHWAWSWAMMALSVWIKYVSLIFLPLLVLYTWQRVRGEREHGSWPVVGGLLMAGGISVLVLFPFWDAALLPGIAGRLLRPINWYAGGTSPVASWLLWAGLLLLGLACLLVLWRLGWGSLSFQRMAEAGFVVALLAFVLGAARSQPWHLIWPAALAGFSERRWAWALIVALSPVLLVVQVWIEWGLPGIGPVF